MDSAAYELGFVNRAAKKGYDDLLGALTPAEKAAFDEALARLRKNPYAAPSDPARLIVKVGNQWRYRVTYRYRRTKHKVRRPWLRRN